MTDEEAIKRIRLLQQEECDCIECRKNKEAYEIVLNLIEKKDKTIDKMAATISAIMKNLGIVKEQLEDGYCEFINSEEEYCWKKPFKSCEDCIKECFEKEEV